MLFEKSTLELSKNYVIFKDFRECPCNLPIFYFFILKWPRYYVYECCFGLWNRIFTWYAFSMSHGINGINHRSDYIKRRSCLCHVHYMWLWTLQNIIPVKYLAKDFQVKHIHWFQEGKEIFICKCGCSRARLPPNK